MLGGITETSVRCRERRRTPTLRRIWIRRATGITGYIGLLSTAECQNNRYKQAHHPDERVPAIRIRFHASHNPAQFFTG
jgi:hypothetical protein